MTDNLKIVNKAIEEHHAIRGHVKLVGDSVSDLEALFALQKARPDWILSAPEALVEKQSELQRTISALDDGLKNHFSFEEKVFPPLFGELLMRALVFEHREINKQIDEAKSLVAKIKLEGLSQKELLSRKSQIQQKVEGILQLVEEHATTEESILKMLQKALVTKG
jgi:hypothetical protein